jgi:adenine-specific DNA methylase
MGKERKKNKSEFCKDNFIFITFVDLSGKHIILIFLSFSCILYISNVLPTTVVSPHLSILCLSINDVYSITVITFHIPCI